MKFGMAMAARMSDDGDHDHQLDEREALLKLLHVSVTPDSGDEQRPPRGEEQLGECPCAGTIPGAEAPQVPGSVVRDGPAWTRRDEIRHPGRTTRVTWRGPPPPHLRPDRAWPAGSGSSGR